ncbi:hypothetical protein ACILPE_07740 [Capnocytophaga canimorsus]|uniref:hypothetical protein n=1 Tax=Capnocytophaga TaxID=1016 RepID=UPI0012FF6DAB|nr:hypothetical protein [Capnocytophaga sp. H2931]
MTQTEINEIMVEYEVVCPHADHELRVLEAYCTCELIALYCKKCGEQLTEPYWDC